MKSKRRRDIVYGHAFYTRADHYRARRLVRFRKYVEEHGLHCQECEGSGRLVDDVIDGMEITSVCGWCEETGLVTRWARGLWLRCQKEGTHV